MGQPWIVNSLFMRATMRILDEDSTETVTIDHIREARQQMIDARETHLDALAVRLEDTKVRKVLESLISGEPNPMLAAGEEFRFCLDLGLVALVRGTPTIANPIYREVIARQMTYATQLAIPEPEWRWQKQDGTLDMDRLLQEFQAFWQTNSETWEEMVNYTEAFPHLLLMAFLQRVTNGHGRIEREYAAGRGRMDLAVEYNGAWNIIEIKLLRKGRTFDAVAEDGIRQTLRYRDTFSPALRKSANDATANGTVTNGTSANNTAMNNATANDATANCYLIVFDRRPEKPAWSERLRWMTAGDVTVIGC
jgi:hypothetical protein